MNFVSEVLKEMGVPAGLLAGTAIPVFLFGVGKENSTLILAGLTMGSLSLVIYFASNSRWWIGHGDGTSESGWDHAKVTGLIISSVVLVMCGAWLAIRLMNISDQVTSVETTQKAEPKPQKIEIPQLTLRQLFNSEFEQTIKYGEEKEVIFRSGLKVRVQSCIYMDHDAKSSFLGFYIPSSPRTYQVTAMLADNYNATLEAGKQISVTASNPGEKIAISSKELTFTGRIFIYHEDTLDLQELAALETLYRSRNLSVQFRGPDYLVSKMVPR